MKLTPYPFLTHNKISFGKYSLYPLRKRDIQKIRKWRNEQINVLRQKIPLTKENQLEYYINTRNLFTKINQILYCLAFYMIGIVLDMEDWYI